MNRTQYVAPIKEAGEVAFNGTGRRSDPFTFPPCSNEIANLAVLSSINNWESGLGFSHRILDFKIADDLEPNVKKVRFLRRSFSETEVNTDTVAFYFDFSNVLDASLLEASPIIWELPSQIAMRFDLAWLHFEGISQNSSLGEPLDVSLFYSCPRGEAAIFIYGACLSNDSRSVAAEAERSFDVMMNMHPEADAPWPFETYRSLYGRFALIGDRMSFVGVTSKAEKYWKVRLTFDDTDAKLREMFGQCMDEIVKAAADHLAR